MTDFFFISICYGFQILLYTFAVVSHCTNDCNGFLQGSRCQRNQREISIHKDVDSLHFTVRKTVRPLIRYFDYSSVPAIQYFAASPSKISDLPAYGKLNQVYSIVVSQRLLYNKPYLAGLLGFLCLKPMQPRYGYSVSSIANKADGHFILTFLMFIASKSSLMQANLSPFQRPALVGFSSKVTTWHINFNRFSDIVSGKTSQEFSRF